MPRYIWPVRNIFTVSYQLMALTLFEKIAQMYKKKITGGVLIICYRQPLHLTRRTDRGISEIETSKPFLICFVCRPPVQVHIGLSFYKMRLPKPKTSCLELILIGSILI